MAIFHQRPLMYYPPMPTPLLRAAPLFSALADPTRLAILERLRLGQRSVGELCAEVPGAQSLISFHLKALRDAGLVFSRKVGRTVWYSLDPSGLARLERLVEILQGTVEDRGSASDVVELEICREYINGG
ncbi:MAG: ArsR/SmtB family transcription factor [Gemmatimonadaceae bacterium]